MCAARGGALGACLWLALALTGSAQASPIFAGDSYTITFLGARVYNLVNGDITQGLVFDDAAGNPSGIFSTTGVPVPASLFSLPTSELYRNQVDAPFDSQVFNSGAGTTFGIAIDDEGVFRLQGAGNLSGLLPFAVTADIVVEGLDPLSGLPIESLTLIENTSLFNAAQPSVLSVRSDGFTIRLSDDFGLDFPSGDIQYQINLAPEPGTALLVCAGLLGMATRSRSRYR